VLAVDKPEFWRRLENLVVNNEALSKVAANGGPAPLQVLRKLPHWAGNGYQMARLFLMAPIRSDRFQPAVR